MPSKSQNNMVHYSHHGMFERKVLKVRRIVPFLMVIVFALTACSGSGDTTVADPPGSTPVTTIENPKINQIIEGWKSGAKSEFQIAAVKPETVEEKVYQSSSSLQDIANFYATLTQKGWYQVRRMPGLQDGVLVAGYEQGTTSLVVGALDASKFGGSGVVIYTIKGSK